MPLDEFLKFKEVYEKGGYDAAIKPMAKAIEQQKPKPKPKPIYKIPTDQELLQQLKKQPISTEKPVDAITQLTRQRQQQQQAQREAISQTPIGKAIINPLAGFGAGLLKGTGVSGLARVSGLPGTAETARIVEEEIARSPISGTIGTVAGAILPGGAASKVAGKVLAPVLKRAGDVTRIAATEGLAGAGLGAGYAALEGQDVGKGALIGGGLGAGLGAGVGLLARRFGTQAAKAPEVTPTAAVPEQPITPTATVPEQPVAAPQRLLPAPAPVMAKAPEAIPLPPPAVKAKTLPGKLTLPGEKAQIKPTTLPGTLKIVNKEYEKVANEYENAIQDIQNYFGTSELRATELARVKNELGIDLDNIVSRLEKAEAKALLPTAEAAKLKRAAGAATEEQYRVLKELTAPAKTFDITEPQQVRGFINQDKLAQKFKIEREAAKAPEPPFPKVPEQFKKETPFTAFKGELQPQKPTAAETARIAEAPPTPTKPVKVAKAAKPTKQIVPEIKQPTKPVVVEPKQPMKVAEFQQMQAKVPAKQFVEATTPISPTGTFKISQTRLNTIARTPEFRQKSKEFIPEKEFGYETQTAKQWKEAGMMKYMSNKTAVIDDLVSDRPLREGADTMAASYAVKEAEKQAIKTGKYENLLTLTKKYAEKIRENARALKAHDLAWEKGPTITNTIRKAQQVIDSTTEQLLKQRPKLKAILDKELADVSRNIQLAVKEATGETIKALRLDLQLFAKKQRDSIEKLIGRHFSTDPLKRGEIINKLVSQFGLEGAEAKKLADRINFVFEQKFNKAADNYLKRLLKSENKQDPTLDKIMKLIRAGAYDDTNIINALKEKYGLPVLTPDEAKNMVKMVDDLNKMKTDSEEYSIQLAKIRSLIEDKEIKTWVDKQRASKNIALLFNPATTFTNILGNVSLGKLDITVQSTIGNVVDKLLSLRTGQRTAGFSDARKLFSGAIKGARDATIDMAGGVRLKDLDGLTTKQKAAVIWNGVQNPIQRPIFEGTENILELKRGLAFKGRNKLQMSNDKATKIIGDFIAAGGKIGRFLENQLYYSLNVFDKSAKRAHYDDMLSFLVKNNKGKELDAIKKQAQQEAIERLAKENITDEKLYADKLKTYYDETLDSLIKGSGSDEIDALKRIAEHIAEERTFTDVNLLSNFGRMVQAFPQKYKDNPRIAQVIEFAINSLAPYITTPLNIAKRGIEYSPLGLTEGIVQLGRLLASKEVPSLARQRYVVDRISRGIAGTVLLMLGMDAYNKGLATGKVPTSKDMREFFSNVQILPNALKIGDNMIDLTKLQPISTTFIAGVNLEKSKKEAELKGEKIGVQDTADILFGAIGDALEFYTELPMIQSLKQLLPASMNDKSFGEKALEFGLSIPQQYIPSLLRKASYVSDDYERVTKDPSLLQEALIKPVKRLIPGVRETLPQKIGTLGEEIKSFGGKNSFWNAFFNPIKVSKVQPTASQAEILRVYEATKDTAVFPNVYTKTLKLPDGKQKVLTAEEMMQYQKIMGDSVNQSIEKLLKSYKYNNLPDTSDKTNNTKLQAIKKTIANSVQIANKEMAKQLGIQLPKEKKRKPSLKIRMPNEEE